MRKGLIAGTAFALGLASNCGGLALGPAEVS